jgi:ADP-heptose:LPS heptosyltransferase
MSQSLICSRSDRLGDLVLTLPAVAHLKRGLPDYQIGLHVSQYAADLGELALLNGVCDFVVFQELPQKSWKILGRAPQNSSSEDLLAFFHGPAVKELTQSRKIRWSLSPRTRLSTIWTYSKTLSQKRSRVEKSEMEYNLDLARFFLKNQKQNGSQEQKIVTSEFKGLAPLKIPLSWENSVGKPSSKIAAIFVNNGASAQNWPLENYLAEGEALSRQGFEVHYHYAGVNAESLKLRLEKAGRGSANFIIREPFPRLRDLLIYISGLSRLVASSTGPLHLGHALGIPVLGVYPKEPKIQSFKRWRPCGYWHSAPVELIEF